ncbi:guanine deaminase [Actibacterium pelagium]|uniref:Guanine deaminase n=1 Tax=Actibacterium pelagium TaxID=2029103 RepID=A0A917AB67_9RHOB|nr:guanine deaminase [Actibacterium pelagium]GGE38114.1 guanine deaminase [Actibacterium pelagium]
MSQPTLLLGQTLGFHSNPFHSEPTEAANYNRTGAILVVDGMIQDLGDAKALKAKYPQAQVVDYGNALISAGFIDSHVHFPQTAMIASWAHRLVDWLNIHTFPEEMRFSDPDYARQIAKRYFDLTLAQGTTTVCSYATIHPESVEAFFTEAQSRGLRALTGKTCMDRNAPEGLQDTPQSAYDDSKALLQRWHGVDRLSYVITPRFSPTSTPEQLEAVGALWSENPLCLMQTHLSEQTDEIEWVRSLFPEARDYLDTYERYGLLGDRAVYGHAIHLEGRERARLKEVGAGLVHCPTSNTFIGSGLFDMNSLMAEGQRIGLATDTGGGSSFSMLRTMAAAYEISQLRQRTLHPAELYWLATQGSANVLHIGDKVGNLAVGMEADLVVLDLASTPAIAQRHAEADDFWEALFPTIMMGDDRAIKTVWIGGREAP